MLPVQHGDGSSAFPLRRHLHEGNALRLPTLPVLDNLDRYDTPRFREKRPELRLGSLKRKVCHVNLSVYLSSFVLQSSAGDNSGDVSVLLKHSVHNSLLSLGGETCVTTSFPQPEHITL